MRTIGILLDKEFRRFFSDKRMVFSSLIFPAVLIYILYSVIGIGYENLFSINGNDVCKIGIVGEASAPELIDIFEDNLSDFEFVIIEDIKDNIYEYIEDGEVDLLLIIPSEFQNDIYSDNMKNTPNIEIYYNSANTVSYNMYNKILKLLERYEDSFLNVFDVNINNDVVYDIAQKSETMVNMIAAMLPIMLMTFIFSGCSALVPESIAGEKEKGTLATILMTPINRKSIVISKIISLSILGLLCGMSSFLGTMLALPKMLVLMPDFNLDYNMKDLLCTILIILMTALLFVSIISVISAWAKSEREANSLMSPILLCIVLISGSTMFTSVENKGFLWYCIPIYNNVLCINGIINNLLYLHNFAMTIICNCLFETILIVILAKLYSSEQIIFSN